jgi:hypothetical protein
MDATMLVASLLQRGIRLSLGDGDGKLWAEPASKLTDEDRRAIRRHKPELMWLLSDAIAPMVPLDQMRKIIDMFDATFIGVKLKGELPN